ncbi:SDR family NAD(P)-dependent oxidoreductase [Streptomyces syringium]|uniref:NAD(P)-dependent dehydrogenase (Short-subunit alcohol dehydrogenase family) n=1 Tax=Streptomyces syringium TaxID=76729 RepID=A0ABS4XXB1_9ACTN|nr:SDR family NAD(P)-dependent oxidoreductase [Streptomyces syringium]MBP2401154.1 NAD(P)-dependent dehydrogenase (short-subunit alcohol dehydrogenase family) [Streptomyces syringium]
MDRDSATAVRAFRPLPAPVSAPGADGFPPFRWSVLAAFPADSLAAALRHAHRPDGEPAIAVVLGATHRPDDDALLLEGAARATATGRRLVLLHRGAGGGSLLRAAALESPGLRVTVLQTAGPVDGTRIAHLVRTARPVDELHVAADGLVTRDDWRPVTLPVRPGPAAARPGGTVLVTGGLGGLGLRAAGVLSRVAGCRPVLLDVTAPAELNRRPAVLLERLRAAGTLVLTADLTDPRAVAAALERVPGPVRAVVHCAGLVAGGPVARTCPEDLARLRAAKVDGLRHVLDVLDPAELRQLVAFGSITARVPHRQMGGYGLANELLRHETLRRAAALPHCATVVAEWSVWSGAGQAHEMRAVDQARRMGMAPVALVPGMTALLCLLRWPPGPAHAASVILTGPGDRTFPPPADCARNSPT